jgi:hypothetical protein
MMGPMRRAPTTLLTAAAVAVSLTGCGLFDGSSRLEDALEYLPADAGDVQFVDRAAVAERFGVDDVEHGSDELDDYLDAMAEEQPPTTTLGRWITPMQEAAFSELDVEWEAVSVVGDGAPARVWKMRDDLDLDEVADALVDAGWSEEDGDGADGDVRRLTIDLGEAADGGLVDDAYPVVELRDLAVIPGEHVIVSGGAPETTDAVADTVTDDEDSLADADDYDDVLDAADTDAVEFAWLARDDRLCAGLPDLSPEQRERVDSEHEGLGHPTAAGAFTRGEEPGEAVLVFDDADTAEADAEARAEYLDEFTATYDIPGDFEVEADDATVRVTTEPDQASVVVQSVARGEGPLFCLPG